MQDTARTILPKQPAGCPVMHYNVYLLMSARQTSHSQLAVYSCFQKL